MTQVAAERVVGAEHWATKRHESGPVRLFLWEKFLPSREGSFAGTILFVHGSSMASTPTFDLQVPGRGETFSAMDYFARLGFDTWCVDCEGYGRSDKDRDSNFPISDGADDCAAAAAYIRQARGVGPLLCYGISSGALRAALFAQREPEAVARLALDAFVWTGDGSPTLEQRRKRLPEFKANNRRPIDRAFVQTIFTRDHPGTADEDVVDAFAAAIVALDDSIPNGTYVDMCENLPIVDPEQVRAPTIIMRGEYDGIAGLDDLLQFFQRLPSSDKQFAIMPGVAHASLHGKNYELVRHILQAFFSQPAPVYRGE
jgi:pimeloyl-ACP methyl ester carboxylesterase